MRAHGRLQRLRDEVEPQLRVDVAAVGLGVQDDDVGAERAQRARPDCERGTVRAVDARPQSVERAAVERARQVRDVLVGASIVVAADGRDVVGTGCRDERSRARASIAASTSSGSLRPPAARSLTPLSVHGLWLAEMTAAGRVVALREVRDAGRRQHADRDDARRLRAASPRQRAPPRCADPTRGCRGRRRTRSAPRTRAAARPSATTKSSVRSASASPRTPSVPNRSTAPRGTTASSTAAPCGPS